MKLPLITAVTIALAASADASRVGHAHHHAHGAHQELAKKDLVEEIVEITVTECWLDGRVLSPEECTEGVRNGTLMFVDGGSGDNPPPYTSFATIVDSPTSVATSFQSPSSAPESSTPNNQPALPVLATQAPSSGNGAASGASNNVMAAVNKEFPDGQLDCSQFPSDYGAIPVDWLDLGGWASIQKPNQQSSAGYSDILTVTKAQCQGATCCLNNSFCSYACPAGYLKTQWPATQGATGQSIGGVSCQNGKLYLTRPHLKTLCSQGSTVVNVTVKNSLSQNVAICRTDYPGDESMSIPLDVKSGETKPLACPDSSNYYIWEGNPTTAQYYLNMPGYSVEQACVWGEPGNDFGNWAPGNIGVGFSNGRAWVSMFPNWPTQTAVNIPYTIEITGGSTECRYSGGQYCTGDNYETCTSSGCTVSADSGELTYILS